jgi:hypothetical protein
MRRSRSSLLLAFTASLTLAGPARAYVRTVSRNDAGVTHVVYWSDPHIKMTVLTGDEDAVPADDFFTAAARGAATWSDPMLGSSIDIAVVRSSGPHVDAAYDKQNTISFKTASWEDGVNYFREQLALTTLYTQGGRIVDADTEINGYDPAYSWAILPDDPAAAADSPDVDLVAALTHELGHVVGLSHPCSLGEAPPGEKTNTGAPVPDCSDPNLPASVRDATMFPSAAPGSITERTLSPDEKLALHDLYSDESGCAIAGRPSPAPTWAGGLGLAVAAFIARRRSRGARAVG